MSNQTQEKLEEKIKGLEAQLVAKKADLARVYAKGEEPSSKLSADLVKLHLELEGMEDALVEMEDERGEASLRERRTEALTDINRAEKSSNEILDGLDEKAESMLKNALTLYSGVNEFNSKAEQVAAVARYTLPSNIYGTRNLNANLLLRVFALAFDSGHDLDGAIGKAAKNVAFNLGGTRETIKRRSERLRQDLKEEIEADED